MFINPNSVTVFIVLGFPSYSFLPSSGIASGLSGNDRLTAASYYTDFSSAANQLAAANQMATAIGARQCDTHLPIANGWHQILLHNTVGIDYKCNTVYIIL